MQPLLPMETTNFSGDAAEKEALTFKVVAF